MATKRNTFMKSLGGTDGEILEVVLLHALPFDASMWRGHENPSSGNVYVPTLYDFGDRLEKWGETVLGKVAGDRLIVVGNSIGGSCALEMATQAPERIAALVLVGAKAGHDPDPRLHREALELLRQSGIEDAWRKYWEPLFAPSVSSGLREEAERIVSGLATEQIAKGVDAFHTRHPRIETLVDLDCPIGAVRLMRTRLS